MTELKTGIWTTINCQIPAPRIDSFLSKELNISRNRIQKLIEENRVRWNGASTRAKQNLEIGDLIEIFLPEPEPLESLLAENIPLKIYFEDDFIAVIEKPAGLVVHPAAGHSKGTLVNALLHHFKELSRGGGIGGKLRPGIVHRIDRYTSGILLVTKTDEAHKGMAEQFKKHSISRRYLGLTWGTLPEKGEWADPIARDPKERKRMAVVATGRTALTRFRRLDTIRGLSYFEAELLTGRTHQIRVHFSSHGFPLVGDAIYTVASRKARQQKEEGFRLVQKKSPALAEKTKNLYERNRQFLHAAHLGFLHPITGKFLEFNSPLPEELREIMLDWEKCK